MSALHDNKFCAFFVSLSPIDCVISATLVLLRIIKSDTLNGTFFLYRFDEVYLYTCFITIFYRVNFMYRVNNAMVVPYIKACRNQAFLLIHV